MRSRGQRLDAGNSLMARASGVKRPDEAIMKLGRLQRWRRSRVSGRRSATRGPAQRLQCGHTSCAASCEWLYLHNFAPTPASRRAQSYAIGGVAVAAVARAGRRCAVVALTLLTVGISIMASR